MRPAERINLIDRISRELQSRYTFTDIDTFLRAFGITPPESISVNSKYVYPKAAISSLSNDALTNIFSELNDTSDLAAPQEFVPPANWQGTSMFRLFISHISKDKNKATRLKECLALHNIAGFVAHEDILPTLEWQIEIERGLRTMDALIAIHTEGFSRSVWTQQEIGYALGRNTKIISLKMGEDPTGFISKQQALARQNRTAEQIAVEVSNILSKDPKTSERLAKANQDAKVFTLDDEIPF